MLLTFYLVYKLNFIIGMYVWETEVLDIEFGIMCGFRHMLGISERPYVFGEKKVLCQTMGCLLMLLFSDPYQRR